MQKAGGQMSTCPRGGPLSLPASPCGESPCRPCGTTRLLLRRNTVGRQLQAGADGATCPHASRVKRSRPPPRGLVVSAACPGRVRPRLRGARIASVIDTENGPVGSRTTGRTSLRRRQLNPFPRRPFRIRVPAEAEMPALLSRSEPGYERRRCRVPITTNVTDRWGLSAPWRLAWFICRQQGGPSL